MNKKLVLTARILTGLMFTVFGINGLMMFTLGKGFIPAPPPEGVMLTIMTGFMATKYLMILVKLLEVIAGVLLLINLYFNLALLLLGPIVVNILCIHLFAAPEGIPVAIVTTVLYGILFFSRWEKAKIIFDKN